MQTGKGKTGSSHMARVALSAFVAMGFLLISFASLAEEIESNIARGGKLYDEWYEIADGDLPSGTHPSYPKEGKKSKNTTWRCQECHGWDYMGKDGAYAKGSHYTGLAGIRASAGADPAAIVAILKSDSHRFSEDNFSDEDFEDISLFVAKGQVEMDKYIDRASMAVKGDKAQGEAYYNTVCAGCHGRNGKQIKDMKAVSAVANGDLWQTLHKILNGQPGEKMPAMRAFPVQVTVDILAYIQTLPE